MPDGHDLPPDITFAKRWTARREFKLRPHDLLFNPQEFGADVIPERLARPFVEAEHYARSYPAGRIAFGLFRKSGVAASELAGVAVISVPMNQNAVPKYLGLAPNSGAEIGRFVLKPEVAFNGESWFLARCLKLLKSERPDIRGLISYADPLERTDSLGRITKPLHIGGIYQASNARFAGRSGRRTIILAPDGSIVSERTLSKIRNEERGLNYAVRDFLATGASPRRPGEDMRDWVRRALEDPSFRRLRHPGNFVYLFALDREAKALAAERNPALLAYPKAA